MNNKRKMKKKNLSEELPNDLEVTARMMSQLTYTKAQGQN
jgi:hypothetical protein